MKRVVILLLFAIVAFTVTACSSASVALISPDAYVAQFMETNAEHLLIDVRTASEYASGHIEGSINIPVEEIASRLSEIPTDIPLVIYCRSGNRSAQAAGILSRNNYSDIYDLGGIISWTNAGYAVQ